MSGTNIYFKQWNGSAYVTVTHPNIQTFFTNLLSLIPATVPFNGQSQTFSGFDFSRSPGFKVTFEVDPTGQFLYITSRSGDQGLNNAFGIPDGTVDPIYNAQHYDPAPALVIDGTYL